LFASLQSATLTGDEKANKRKKVEALKERIRKDWKRRDKQDAVKAAKRLREQRKKDAARLGLSLEDYLEFINLSRP